MTSWLALVAFVGTGTVGGVFFAFSAFVMKALAELPDGHGIFLNHVRTSASATAAACAAAALAA